MGACTHFYQESLPDWKDYDPHWKVELTDSQWAVRTCQLGEAQRERDNVLRERLRIGDAVNDKQKEELVHVLVELSKPFALSDDELGCGTLH